MNKGPDDLEDVRIEAVMEGITFASTKVDLDNGETGFIRFSVRGMVWEEKSFTATATGDLEEGYLDEDSVTLTLIPDVGIEITYPNRELKLVDVEDGSNIDFDVHVESEGGLLRGVELTVGSQWEKLECIGGATRDIEAHKTVKFPVTCYNVSSGDSMTFKVRDSHSSAIDLHTVTFRLVQSVKNYAVEIVSPKENEKIVVSERGSQVITVVRNTGEEILKGVCARIDELNITSECEDIAVGALAQLELDVKIPSDLQTYIRVHNDGEEATKKVGVILDVIESIIAIPDTVSGNITPTQTNDTNSNESGEDITIIAGKETQGNGEIDLDPVLGIAIPLAILGIFILLVMRKLGKKKIKKT
jgi:hypothetical protein